MNLSGNTPSGTARPGRLQLLDEIRGITLINMLLYHFLWDLVYIADIEIPWYHGRAAHIWQQGICWSFLFLSGFCWSLGTRQLRRGLTVWLAGGLVTVVTVVLMPENRVVFGVLTLIGSAMLLMIPIDRLLGKVKSLSGIILLMAFSGLLFLTFLPAGSGRLANFAGIWRGEAFLSGGFELPRKLYHGWLAAYLGFPPADFYSTDYFPLLPWFFLFTTGYLFHKLCARLGWLETELMKKRRLPLPAAAGRHSLLIYMLHQPILYGITIVIIHMKTL